MRTLNKDEHNYIKQIANIHETLLSQVESNYKCTKLSIALEKWAKTMNAKRISSTIHKSNLPMISLNKDLGYQVSHVKM
ncbi:GNAT family N-acetyltransferase, partial [Staphylococcus aureus]|nr:GNAT family N-acetyltransferase [Staphylococcus aureus]